ncbi:CmcI family methyltransferase [Bradyrhizobium sp. AZCC 1699]|uniref:CmcI family methyltransferase n=1 Tax=Bradyrhizobium sp. AZCC 1699 TaxID=3117024 RepID=UPI002FEF2017
MSKKIDQVTATKWKRVLAAVKQITQKRMIEKQLGIGTYFDNWVLSLEESQVIPSQALLNGMLAQLNDQRFCDFKSRYRRRATTLSDLSQSTVILSQGLKGGLSWSGLSLLKSAFDLALYVRLLDEIRPSTIIEIGSGSGASAIFFADLCRSLGCACHVTSVDVRIPQIEHPDVTFVEGDCSNIARLMPISQLRTVPRPLIVIEDAHQCVKEVLCHFSSIMLPGDRFVVEDSADKQEIIQSFLCDIDSSFLVDTAYTDFFGFNGTSAINSFLVKIDR